MTDEFIQEWLRQHGPFDAVVDGANVGLHNQHHFSFFEVGLCFYLISYLLFVICVHGDL